jgi:plasmid stability protein
MAQILLRKLDDRVKAGLQRRARRNRRSLEAEAREILHNAVRLQTDQGKGLGTRISERFAGFDLTEFDVEERRGQAPRAPKFDE